MADTRHPDDFYVCEDRKDPATGATHQCWLRGPLETEQEAREQREILIRKGRATPDAYIIMQRLYD